MREWTSACPLPFWCQVIAVDQDVLGQQGYRVVKKGGFCDLHEV